MRKLSELYQVVLYYYLSSQEYGICLVIARIVDKGIIYESEWVYLINHLTKGDHKFPKQKRIFFWFKTREERIAYLEYLIKLCKEQDI